MKVGVVICILCVLFGSGEAHPRSAPLRVPFNGNSYTYYHRLPDIVSGMAARAENPRRFKLCMIAQGGASLFRHRDEGSARRALRSGKWDVVVLQERGLGPLSQPQNLTRHAARFADKSRAAGARVVLNGTWTRRDKPERQSAIYETYAAAARASRSESAPVGAA